MARLGGALHLTDAGAGWTIAAGEGAVARRLHAFLGHLYAVRPEIEVHQRTPLQSMRYRLVLAAPADDVLQRLGLLDGDRRPVEAVPDGVADTAHDRVAFLRGAVMVAGSVSDPRRAAHLEIRVPGEPTAELVRDLLRRCGATAAGAARRDDGWRVFVKSGAAIGAVLTRIGAHAAFLAWDGARLRRELRSDANRATNADEANLGRSVAAAARQVAAIEAAVARLGWQRIPDDLRETALTRLANPESSIAELASLHSPPVGKGTVHRRLARIAALVPADPDPERERRDSAG